jgi:NO-binding membrane sensor protein with MHYT domain/GGDEF domain-containing protein
MLAYEPGAPVSFDPVLTIISLLVAIAGAKLGFVVAGGGATRLAAIGGGIVGLAISAMHYTGMMAYRVHGIVEWDMAYLVASIALSVVLSATALHLAGRRDFWSGKIAAAGMLVLAIVSLHFTAMTAFRVSPMLIADNYSNPGALQAMALAVAVVGLIIVGTGLVSYLIDHHTREASYRKLHHMALHDSMTGLPNRASFNNHLDRELDLAQAAGGKVALIGIDLDGFKEINDIRGHSAGDEVLRVLAERMTNLLQEGEFVARLGGDEFGAVYRMQDQAGLMSFLRVIAHPITRLGRIGQSG